MAKIKWTPCQWNASLADGVALAVIARSDGTFSWYVSDAARGGLFSSPTIGEGKSGTLRAAQTAAEDCAALYAKKKGT